MTITYIDENTEEQTVTLPSRWEICSRCRGNGTIVNPAVDGSGISPDEFREDPDFEEAYRRGDYDIPCVADCDNGKVRVPDEERMTAEHRRIYKVWRQQQREVRESYRMEAAERRMGARRTR